MARPEKIAIVDEIAEKIERTQSLYLTDFTGLDVEAITELRRLLRENAVEYLVVKNTLARLAVEKAGREDLKPYLIGPTAMAFGFEDPTLPAKLLSRFAQKTGKPTVKAILFEEQLYGQEVMDRLQNLPSREELLSQMLSGLKAPITQIAMVFGGLLRNFMGLLKAISGTKGEDEKRAKDVPTLEEAEATDKAEVEAEGQAKEKAEAKAQEKDESKAEAKTQKRTEEEAEQAGGQVRKSTEEAQTKPADQKSSREEEKHKAQTTDSQEAKEKESPGEEPENTQKQQG